MQISEEELKERFRALADDELLSRVQAGTLTPIALAIATAELRSRGMEVPSALAAADESDEQVEPDEEQDLDLVTVAQFSNPLQASVLRACLESHGLFVHVWGEHLGVAHIFLSIASGGVRVQVRSDQVAQAKEVIAAFERGDFALDEEPE